MMAAKRPPARALATTPPRRMMATIQQPNQIEMTPQRVAMLLDEVAEAWQTYGDGPHTFNDEDLERLIHAQMLDVTQVEVTYDG